MKKRIKIDFKTINKTNYKIIPPEKIFESDKRIKEGMKKILRKLRFK